MGHICMHCPLSEIQKTIIPPVLYGAKKKSVNEYGIKSLGNSTRAGEAEHTGRQLADYGCVSKAVGGRTR